MCLESVHILMNSPSSYLLFAIIKECEGLISLGNSGSLQRHGSFLFALASVSAIAQNDSGSILP